MIKFTYLSSKLLFFLLFICLLVFTLAVVYYNNTTIVYVDGAKVFENFSMSKEAKSSGDKEYLIRQAKLDSLYAAINHSNSNDSLLIKKLISEKQKMEQFSAGYSTNQSVKIWSRISSYAAEFLKEKNYDIILGAQPGYNIIAGSKDTDVTQEFINYINNKYEGR
jgi:outer membrane protein